MNPSMDGFILESWFFAELRHNCLSRSFYVCSLLQRRQWEKPCIYFFDPSIIPIRICLDNPTWLAPMKWNQGGYDTVFVDKTKGLVRFMQIMRAEKHDFQEISFAMLLNKLANQLNQITQVEMYFVPNSQLVRNFLWRTLWKLLALNSAQVGVDPTQRSKIALQGFWPLELTTRSPSTIQSKDCTLAKSPRKLNSVVYFSTNEIVRQYCGTLTIFGPVLLLLRLAYISH